MYQNVVQRDVAEEVEQRGAVLAGAEEVGHIEQTGHDEPCGHEAGEAAAIEEGKSRPTSLPLTAREGSGYSCGIGKLSPSEPQAHAAEEEEHVNTGVAQAMKTEESVGAP